jgi:tRNA-dependent cyclodipeptide synthase
MREATVRAEKDAASIAGTNIFIPISLGNHYYSLEILGRVLTEFVANSQSAVVFLCDRLRMLSYMIRGEMNLEQITANIKLQLDQLTRSLIKLGLDTYPNATVANWSFLQDDPRYGALLAGLDQFVGKDPVLHQELESYAAVLMQRFRGAPGQDTPGRIALQRQYVIEETALSLYMTEIRAFNVEVYRRGMGFVDALYRERPAELMSMLGKSKLERKFVSLEEWIARTERKNAGPSHKRAGP